MSSRLTDEHAYRGRASVDPAAPGSSRTGVHEAEQSTEAKAWKPVGQKPLVDLTSGDLVNEFERRLAEAGTRW